MSNTNNGNGTANANGNAHMPTTPSTPGLRRLRASPKAPATRAAVLADQRAARAAAAKKAAKPQPKGKGAPAARLAKPGTEPRLRLLAKENPHRPGTGLAKRFDLMRTGMTVEEFVAAVIKAGGNRDMAIGHIMHGVARKYLVVDKK